MKTAIDISLNSRLQAQAFMACASKFAEEKHRPLEAVMEDILTAVLDTGIKCQYTIAEMLDNVEICDVESSDLDDDGEEWDEDEWDDYDDEDDWDDEDDEWEEVDDEDDWDDDDWDDDEDEDDDGWNDDEENP